MEFKTGILENMEITSSAENFEGKKGFEYIFSNIENNRYFNIFINFKRS